MLCIIWEGLTWPQTWMAYAEALSLRREGTDMRSTRRYTEGVTFWHRPNRKVAPGKICMGYP